MIAPGRRLFAAALGVALGLLGYWGGSAVVEMRAVDDEARRLRVEFNTILASLTEASEKDRVVSLEWTFEQLAEIDRVRASLRALPSVPPPRRGDATLAVIYYRSALDRLDAAVRELGPFRSRGVLSRLAAQEFVHRAREQWDQAEDLYLR